MRITKVYAKNFASYDTLDFEYNNLGLALVLGSTGSGKSTLLDAVTWVLFGKTSKNGTLDEVRAWNSTEATSGTVFVELFDKTLEITRVRGSSKENDLFYTQDGSTLIRGKDIKETQVLVDEVLGLSGEDYITATCFNEFSRTGNFFTSSAKDRRKLFESIANLETAILISERAADERKEAKKEIQLKQSIHSKICGRQEQLTNSQLDAQRRKDTWLEEHQAQLERIAANIARFNKETANTLKVLEQRQLEKADAIKHKQQDLIRKIDAKNIALNALTHACITCKQPHKEYYSLLKEKDMLEVELISLSKESGYVSEIAQVKTRINPHKQTYEAQKNQVNPFISQLLDITSQLIKIDTEKKQLEEEIDAETYAHQCFNDLYDLSYSFRATLLFQAVENIQNHTNIYLEKHFDGEIKVKFTLSGSDDLDIEITKNSNLCSYSQLSRGQRSMLRLCFSIAVMQASANRSGNHFNLLCFDEVLDGLSANLKLQALGLFRELELDHESILLIDHATELHSQFDRIFNVTLDNDYSIIKEV